MSKYGYTKPVGDELSDLHQGLHVAMDQFINERNYEEAGRIIRIIDQRMSDLINRAKVIYPE